MFIALVDRDGFIEMVGPQSIARVAPLADGALVMLTDGRCVATRDGIGTLRRRLRGVSRGAPGRDRLLRRLWVSDMWRAARTRLSWPLRHRAR